MSSITLSQINIYPLKSGAPTMLESSQVVERGLNFDRHWALFDANMEVITGRTQTSLMKVSTEVKADEVIFSCAGFESIAVSIIDEASTPVDLNIFSSPGNGVKVGREVDEWFSEVAQQKSNLFFMNSSSERKVTADNGGQAGDVVSYADQSPILLTNVASLTSLNQRIGNEDAVMQQFRPNLVVDGAGAFTEDDWKFLSIGNCEFEVNQACVRCIFTTVDVNSYETHPRQEPLRTLAAFRKERGQDISFGIHLIPRKLGMIRKGDTLSFR